MRLQTQSRLGSVYPRVGGGNRPPLPYLVCPIGLSPRGRGKPICHKRCRRKRRSIPAWAGETDITPVSHRSQWVYPRVGGGNRSQCCISSPFKGLSPRGRGKLSDDDIAGIISRSIPAWAGETRAIRRGFHRQKVYPRVGGGNDIGLELWRRWSGLSPRGRGKRACVGGEGGI